MGLAAAEKAGDPDSVFAGSVGLGLDGREQHRDQIVDVRGQLSGDDELVELLPHGGGVDFVGLDDAVNGAMDVAFKKVLDLHASFQLGIKVKAR